jgi:hypothetical protein
MSEIKFVCGQYQSEFLVKDSEEWKNRDGESVMAESEVEILFSGQANEGSKKFLLWGEVEECKDGWSRVFEARVGHLWVPIQAQVGEQICVSYSEITEEDQYGNVFLKEVVFHELKAKRIL